MMRSGWVLTMAWVSLAPACNSDGAATGDTRDSDTTVGGTVASETGSGETDVPVCVPKVGAVGDATCDGIDDDCDGSTDEDYVGEVTTCDQGTCVATGAFICKDGLAAADCTGQPCVPKWTLAVHDLAIAGLTDACFDVRIANADGEVVLSRGDPTHALHTGNTDANADTTVDAAKARGAVCHSDPGAAAANALTLTTPLPVGSYDVTLWVHSLFNAQGALGWDEWRNPCGPSGSGTTPASWGGGCTLRVAQQASGSTVEVNLAIMQDAAQGFFDVALTFGGVVCSAKVDTCTGANAEGTGGGDPVKLLFADSVRVQTAVVAFACTGVVPGADAVLYATDLTLTCEEDGSATAGWQPQERALRLDMTRPEGNQLSAGPNGLVYQWALYRGTENLSCGTGTCAKRYWNAAIAVRENAPSDVPGASPGNANCRITGSFTGTPASGSIAQGPSGDGFAAGPFSNLPSIAFSVRLTDASAHWDCRSVPMLSVDPAGADYDLDGAYPENTGGEFKHPGFCGTFAGVAPARASGAGCAL